MIRALSMLPNMISIKGIGLPIVEIAKELGSASANILSLGIAASFIVDIS